MAAGSSRPFRQHSRDSFTSVNVQQVSKELTSEAVSAGFQGGGFEDTGSEVVKAIEVLLKHQSFFHDSQRFPRLVMIHFS